MISENHEASPESGDRVLDNLKSAMKADRELQGIFKKSRLYEFPLGSSQTGCRASHNFTAPTWLKNQHNQQH